MEILKVLGIWYSCEELVLSSSTPRLITLQKGGWFLVFGMRGDVSLIADDSLRILFADN